MHRLLCQSKSLVQVVVSLCPFLLGVFDIALSECGFDVFEEFRELSLLFDGLGHGFLCSVIHEGVPIVQQE
jgi:hypothetical protein